MIAPLTCVEKINFTNKEKNLLSLTISFIQNNIYSKKYKRLSSVPWNFIKVSDNIEVAELTIDGRRVSISNSGSFTHNLFVPQDGIKVSIEATDNSGLTTKEIIVFPLDLQ